MYVFDCVGIKCPNCGGDSWYMHKEKTTGDRVEINFAHSVATATQESFDRIFKGKVFCKICGNELKGIKHE